MRLDEDAGDADRDGRARQHRHEAPLAAASRPLPARLLHRMGRVEDHRRARLGQDRQRAHVGDERVVAEGDAALGDQHVRIAGARRPSPPRCFMSQGARNWPFLTLTGLPVAAAASSRSVWRQRKAGICSTSTTSATAAHCSGSCTSVTTGQPDALADLGEDRQAPASSPSPRALAALVRFALSKEVL